MKKNELIKLFIVAVLVSVFNLRSRSQTSLIFEDFSAVYKSSYTFSTGDVIYFSQGKKTNKTGTCEGSAEGIIRINRVQDSTIIMELKYSSLSSLTIFGRPKDNVSVKVNKIQVSTSLDGTYQNITSNAIIQNDMHGNVNCGCLSISGLNIKKGCFVKFNLTSSVGTNTSVNISELYLITEITDVVPLIVAEKKIIDRKYYSVLGVKLKDSSVGLVIVKEIYEDGSFVSRKVFEFMN